MFKLHPHLEADTTHIGDFVLCRLLLMNDANYPWFILVPRRPEITEIHQLTDIEQSQLIQESSLLSEAMATAFQADKLNVAALGNVVPQLHIHHIARFQNDPCWPKPVWGQVDAKPYTSESHQQTITKLLNQFNQTSPAPNFQPVNKI